MKIFISRSRERAESLVHALESRNAEVTCTPLIETIPIDAPHPSNEHDWIFFSSRNCVKHYFSANPVIHNAKLGAVGPMTAEALKEFGEVDFIGRNNDTEQVKADFADRVGEGRVLFPRAKTSLRTIQKGLKEDQVEELVCYETLARPVQILESDVYLFTSPSNVKSFSRVNDFPNQALYLAGPTTRKELVIHGVGNPIALPNWKESTILDAIFSETDS